MKKTRELGQILKTKNMEAKKAQQAYNKEKLSEKLSCLSELILKNNALSEMILRLPNDECKIIFKELISSDEFTVMVEKIIQNSMPLQELRKKKRVKAEMRKQKAAAQEQPAVLEKENPEQDTESVPNQQDFQARVCFEAKP